MDNRFVLDVRRIEHNFKLQLSQLHFHESNDTFYTIKQGCHRHLWQMLLFSKAPSCCKCISEYLVLSCEISFESYCAMLIITISLTENFILYSTLFYVEKRNSVCLDKSKCFHIDIKDIKYSCRHTYHCVSSHYLESWKTWKIQFNLTIMYDLINTLSASKSLHFRIEFLTLFWEIWQNLKIHPYIYGLGIGFRVQG